MYPIAGATVTPPACNCTPALSTTRPAGGVHLLLTVSYRPPMLNTVLCKFSFVQVLHEMGWSPVTAVLYAEKLAAPDGAKANAAAEAVLCPVPHRAIERTVGGSGAGLTR